MNSEIFSGFVDNYGALDGTVEFYGRLQSLINSDSVVLNLGAGRGAWSYIDKSTFRRRLQDLKAVVKCYIGADIDPVVMTNPTTHKNLVIKGGHIPIEDNSCDLVISDYVLEHVEDIESFEKEVCRVLRPGGWFCARTPHSLNYVCLAARVVANVRHNSVLRYAQPGRMEEDVFPTRYRCNTFNRLKKAFPACRWNNFSYLYSAEPSYFFGRRAIFKILFAMHRFLPLALVGNLFIFLRKRDLYGVDSHNH